MTAPRALATRLQRNLSYPDKFETPSEKIGERIFFLGVVQIERHLCALLSICRPEPLALAPEPCDARSQPLVLTPEPWEVRPEPLALAPEPWEGRPEPLALYPEPWEARPEPLAPAPEPWEARPPSPNTHTR